jgi:hypothetical protein
VTDSSDTARLHRLERQVSRMRRLALAVVCAIPLGVGVVAMRSRAPAVQADRLELMDAAGRRQAVLKSDSLGVDLLLLDAKGRVRTAIRLDADTTLSVLDGDGRVMGQIGGPRVRHLQ